MTTPTQIDANRKNASRSTGPKTQSGRGRSSRNAVRHGFRSELAVLPFEQVEAWERHRDGVIRSLTPVGTLEEALAFRVALCLWRLQRVAVYEAATATAAIESVADELARHQTGDPIAILVAASANDLRQLSKAEEELDKVRGHLEGTEEELAILQLLTDRADDATLVDGGAAGNVLELADSSVPRDEDDVAGGLDIAEAAFLVRVGVPEDELDAPWDWQGWTAGMVRRGIALVATHAEFPVDKLLTVISHHPSCPVVTLPLWTLDGGLVMATTRLRPTVPPPWPPIPRFHPSLPLPSRAISSFFSLFPR